ncbi:leupaxin isoform X4 [Pan troglodytes]|uniref:leupaxin isoform X4 n=1 Tax=Pan troglodytes TaxID=9598 RepID=UPI0030135693
MEELDALLEELERSTLQDSDEYSNPAPLPLDQHSRKETNLDETSEILSVQDNTSPLLAQLVYTTNIQELNVYSEAQEPKESPPPSKTSAAAQLDELMAHLTEMQAKVAVRADAGKKHLPDKQDHKASLDSMLGGLEQELQDLGIATVPKGHCASCQKPIAGKVIHALGQSWHPEHFVCTHCKEEIGSSPFFERSGLAYCPNDYHQLFSPRCAYCAAPILDKVLTAMNQTWHPEHFFCSHCGEVFGAEGMTRLERLKCHRLGLLESGSQQGQCIAFCCFVSQIKTILLLVLSLLLFYTIYLLMNPEPISHKISHIIYLTGCFLMILFICFTPAPISYIFLKLLV